MGGGFLHTSNIECSAGSYVSSSLAIFAKIKSCSSLCWAEYGMSLICLDGIRGTTKDPCLEAHLLKGLFSRVCGQNYLDSQRFYFHLLILIGPGRFNKSFFAASAFLSDRSKCLSFSNCGLKLTLNLSANCLYGVGQGIDNFWLCPWIMICKLPGPPCISYNL